MKWFDIFKFELKYRSKRPATYIYFTILFALVFAAVTTDAVTIGGGVGQVKENSPYSIALIMTIVSAFMLFITSAVMGVPVLRDFEHKMESLMFSTPIKKFDYLLGRFAGSFVVLLFIFSSLVIGLMLGDVMPWREQEKLLAFNVSTYIRPFLIIVIPNLFFTACLFFASGSLSRKMIFVYTQGVFLLVIYMIGNALVSDLENRELLAVLDPFGLNTLRYYTQYWTPAERNILPIQLEGVMLYNRMIWMGAGILGMLVTFLSFNFNVVRNTIGRRKKVKKSREEFTPSSVTIPLVTTKAGVGISIKQLLRMSFFYFKTMFKEIPFLGILLSGLVLTFANTIDINEIYGVDGVPTTYAVLEVLGGFNLFFLIIIVFYAGEMIWKERSVKMNQIFDALPIHDMIGLLGKFFGMLLVHVTILGLLILSGVFVQTVKGYYNYELSLYFSKLFGETFVYLILFTFLGFFIQVLVNNKMLGFVVMVVFFIASGVLSLLGVEHAMFHFGNSFLGRYSDMNGFGHFVSRFTWMNVYWMAFAIFLFVLAVLFSVRGADTVMKSRLNLARLKLNRSMMILGILSLLTFALSGCYIFYNTNVVNEYANSDEEEKLQASYEKTLKQYESLPQPKIVDVNLKVDLYPQKRDFIAGGYYVLENKTDTPIREIHIQEKTHDDLELTHLQFDREASKQESFEDFDYTIYALKEPLLPGEQIQMDFKVVFETKGFKEGTTNTNIVNNGTFFNNLYFPTIGYNSDFELGDDDKRKDHELPEKERMLEREDEVGLSRNLFGDDADRINFEMVVSTDAGQTAIAPGYLQKEWIEGDRRYFHYKMDKPMVNFYSIVSANFEVMREKWEGINLEIYYNKGHERNLGRMMKGLKKALAFASKEFGPYQYQQLRIMEFPRYSSFAQSFANTIPFSEGMGFMLDLRDEKDMDFAFYVTAHEVAHQWWGHQVTEADVKGSSMLSETLSQYTAMMVLKKEYPVEQLRKFLKYELDRYLRGRTSERKKEMPLELVERQSYIHYRKGSVAMFALQDYISEDSVNAALRAYLQDWKYKENPYPTTKDLLGYFRQVTPDSLQYVIHDLFETITLFENKTEEVNYEKLSDGKYKVNLKVGSIKYRADSTGMEKKIPVDDWIDLGV
ncbi:ABC transporter permease/M1 family aminopeptidase, partial [Xanthovirga aplysinae]|uniref:ABC transporter permease/M1 family aminopeptidase n=1 Tax=Xanthovirga aplysinae TaxID=2529853 RepID=UPI0012BD42D2